jgi:hypothetical protein
MSAGKVATVRINDGSSGVARNESFKTLINGFVGRI